MIEGFKGNLDPLRQNLNIDERYNKVAEKLGMVVGKVHPRLKLFGLRRSAGDNAAAALTYGQIVERLPVEINPGLPVCAKRSYDSLTTLLLMEGHLGTIDASLDKPKTRLHPITLGGFNVVNIIPTPVVEGYEWYRGYNVNVGSECSAILFAPYIRPYKIGGSPFPILYTIGEILPEYLADIAGDFGTTRE